MKAYLVTNPLNPKSMEVAQVLRLLFPRFGICAVDNVKRSDVIFSVGGDGTLAYAIYLHLEERKPFVGVNAGSVGFCCFLGKESLELGLQEFLRVKEPVSFQVLEAYFSGKKEIAIQDARVERITQRSVHLQIKNEGEILAKRHGGDGIIIANSLGSTGYNESAGGPVLKPEDQRVVLTPICPFVHQGDVYDSIRKSQIFSQIDFEVIAEEEVRIVLDNRPHILSTGVPVRIRQSDKKFQLYLRR